MNRGTILTYGLPDGRQIPCKVIRINKKRMPIQFKVIQTIPGLCYKGQIIKLPYNHWDSK